MDTIKIMQKWLIDITFFVVVFIALSMTILVVNLATRTAHGLSGNALATVLLGLLFVRYRWKGVVPGLPAVALFSIFAGACSVFFLFLLQFSKNLDIGFEFEPATGYEFLLAFIVNCTVFSVTLAFRRQRLK